MTDTVPCPRCKGSGYLPMASANIPPCDLCCGSGRVYTWAIEIGRLKRKLARCRTKRDKLAKEVQDLERYSRTAGWLRVKEGMEAVAKERAAMSAEREKLYATVNELKAQLWDKKAKK